MYSEDEMRFEMLGGKASRGPMLRPGDMPAGGGLNAM